MSMAATISLFGCYPQLSLAQARKKAFDTWQQIDSGKDPIREKKRREKNKQKSD